MYIKVLLIVWIDDTEQDKPSEVVINGNNLEHTRNFND